MWGGGEENDTCLPSMQCNDVGKSEAIAMGTSHFLPNDSIENELVKCKHEVVSKALYIHSIVDVVESQNKECVLLKNSSKIHLAACFDGKSYATIVCKLSRSSTKGKCNSCKGVKCNLGHLCCLIKLQTRGVTIWKKILKSWMTKKLKF